MVSVTHLGFKTGLFIYNILDIVVNHQRNKGDIPKDEQGLLPQDRF